MKKQIITILLATLLAATACYRDKGNYNYRDVDPVTVTGIAESYVAFSYQDVLRVNPAVTNEERYDFCWLLYSTAFNVNARVIPRPDTIARSKNLEYAVRENPGSYILVFSARDKETGYTELTTVPLTVTTVNMTGWYVLKDNGGKTEFDFFATDATPAPTVANWISLYNDGRQLDGAAVKAVFVPGFKITPNDDPLNVFAVVSGNDAAIIRIDNGEIIMDYDNMFFIRPLARNPQNIILDLSENTIYMINDHILYTMNKVGGLFVDPPSWDYRVSPLSAISFSPLIIVFDEQAKSLIRFGNNLFSPYNDASTALKLNNLDAEVMWMEGYNYPRWRVYALLEHASPAGTFSLVKLQNDYGGSTSVIGESQDIPSTLQLPHADKWAGNFEYDIIYFARDNKLYRANMDTNPPVESLQVTFEPGEVITCMQHMVKPVPQSPGTVVKNCLAVATYAAGRYKVYLYSIEVGNLVPLEHPNFQGEGRVTTVNYVQPDGSLRVF
ncbi:MAG: hypothetical protein LBI96_04590 [Odoribacteraceae bacterium]|jgi:hypothetical protein|nr:hypothetical protein [Odoribacteraceae bacterium]